MKYVFIQFESNTLWTKSTDLGDYMEKSIRVTGRIVRGVSPYRSFPVAKQDEDGAWSQGVGAPTDFVDPNAQLLGIPQKPSKKKEASKDHRAWFIEIQKISAVE